MFRSYIVLAALICDRLTMDEQREFLHGDLCGCRPLRKKFSS